MPTGRPHPPEFKAKAVMQVISGEKTLNDVAAEYDLNPNLVRKWRNKFEQEAYRAFSAIEEHGAPAMASSDPGLGVQLGSLRALLKDSHVLQSMDGKARWVDNVIVERWFRSLKSECMNIEEYETPRESRGIIDEYVRKYNDRGLHESLDCETPASWYYSGIAARLAA